VKFKLETFSHPQNSVEIEDFGIFTSCSAGKPILTNKKSYYSLMKQNVTFLIFYSAHQN